MSADNVATAHRVFAAVARRELDVLLDLVHPEVRWQSLFAALSESGEYNGGDDMRQYWRTCTRRLST
jgi:ketosteroid isomerase-like protein